MSPTAKLTMSTHERSAKKQLTLTQLKQPQNADDNTLSESNHSPTNSSQTDESDKLGTQTFL